MYITSSRRTVQLGYMQGVYERFPIQMLIRYRYRHIHGRIKIERTGGSICVTPVVGIHCVHYIEEKDYTARSATGGTYMTDSRLKTKQVHTTHQPHSRKCTAEGPSSLLSLWIHTVYYSYTGPTIQCTATPSYYMMDKVPCK